MIDIAFIAGEACGIVDYKTDEATGGKLRDLVEKYRAEVHTHAEAFETAAGQRIRETGLYFTKSAAYVPCPFRFG